MTMLSFFSSSWFGQAVRSRPQPKRNPRPSLELLEDRTLLSFWVNAMPSVNMTARGALAGVTAGDGRIYAIGGDPTPFNPPIVRQLIGTALSTVERYSTDYISPFVNTWAGVAPLPAPRAGLAAAVSSVPGVNGKIYAFGGVDTTGTPQSTLFSYTAGGINSWTTVAPFTAMTARSYLAAATDGYGRIYAIGGNTDNGAAASGTNIVERYSPTPL